MKPKKEELSNRWGDREKDCSEEKRECCSLIIWLFMQNAESPPIRVGDLELRGLIGRGPDELCIWVSLFFPSSLHLSPPPLNLLIPLSSPSVHSALHCSLASTPLSPSFVKGCHWEQGQSLVIPIPLTTLSLRWLSDAKRITERKEGDGAKQQVQELKPLSHQVQIFFRKTCTEVYTNWFYAFLWMLLNLCSILVWGKIGLFLPIQYHLDTWQASKAVMRQAGVVDGSNKTGLSCRRSEFAPPVLGCFLRSNHDIFF